MISEPRTTAQPWDKELPEVKPGLGESGYIDETVHSLPLPELIAALDRGAFRSRPLVWTPDSSRLATPAEVRALRAAYQSGLRKRALALRLKWKSVGLVALGVVVMLLSSTAEKRGENGPAFLALGLVLVLSGLAAELIPRIADYRDSRRDPIELGRDESRSARHAFWIEDQSSPYPHLFVILLGLVFLVQLPWRAESVLAAGFDAKAIWGGEWWRLFTAPMLHANAFHIAANAGAIIFAAERIEAHLHRAYWPLAFLVGALYGGFASLLTQTSKPMIGASGGAMGMIGFLLVYAYRRRRDLPPSLLRSIGTMILMTGIIGAVGYKVIGNAAHAGGLASGMLLGLLLPVRAAGSSPGKPVLIAGLVAAGIVVASALGAIAVIARLAFQ